MLGQAISKVEVIYTVDKKKIELGHFVKFDDAVQARRNAEDIYHKEFSLRNSVINGGQIYV